MFLVPGDRHPNAHLTWAEAAGRLGLSPEALRPFVDRGLPHTDEGVDAFVLMNWVGEHALTEVPALARRWRIFLAHFRRFITDPTLTRQVVVDRRQQVFSPLAPSPCLWTLPRLVAGPGQQVLEDHLQGLLPAGAHHRGVAGLTVTGTAEVLLRPVIAPAADLVPLVEDVVQAFDYGYRHHVPADVSLGDRQDGTCLDLALAVGRAVGARGRPWRLVSGVVARTSIANPHFWLEVEDVGGGWIPVDPALPALARRFGQGDEWRAWVRAWTGGRDPGCVTLARGDIGVSVPGGATLGSAIGEVVIDGRNAWACLDWVCGVCTWGFREIRSSGAVV